MASKPHILAVKIHPDAKWLRNATNRIDLYLFLFRSTYAIFTQIVIQYDVGIPSKHRREKKRNKMLWYESPLGIAARQAIE